MAITQILKENIRNPTDTVSQHRSQKLKQDNVGILITFQPLCCEEF